MGKFQPVARYSNGQRQIGVVGDDDRLLIIAVIPVHNQVGGDVHIRAFFFCGSHLHIFIKARNGICERAQDDAVFELPVVYFQVGYGSQRTVVNQLASLLLRIFGATVNDGGEVSYAIYFVGGQQGLA